MSRGCHTCARGSWVQGAGSGPHRPRLLTTTGSGTASRGCSGGWHVHMRSEMTSGRGSGAGGSCVTSFLASAACRYLRQVSSQPLHRRAGRQQQQQQQAILEWCCAKHVSGHTHTNCKTCSLPQSVPAGMQQDCRWCCNTLFLGTHRPQAPLTPYHPRVLSTSLWHQVVQHPLLKRLWHVASQQLA